MNYFKKADGDLSDIYYFSDQDIARGFSDGYIPLTEQELYEHLNPTPTPEQMAYTARFERDRQLKQVYDPGIQMVRRELEMTSDSAYTAKLITKRNQLNQYAKDLQNIPEQTAFPQTIVWPEIPTKDLE